MKENRVKEALEKKNVAFGTWVQMSSPETAELASYAGFDFVIVDTEHGSFGIETAVSLFRAIELGGASPFIRLPDDNKTGILKALDAGAMGILVPGVSTKGEAEDIVKVAKFSPNGFRGACPLTRSTGHGIFQWSDYVKWSNEETMVWLLIESPEGIENIEEILSVEGIDAIALGVFDLSVTLGLPGQIDHPYVESKLSEITKLAREKNTDVVRVILDSNPGQVAKEAKEWIAKGCRIITSASDRQILSQGYSENISVLRSL
ncbi:HpcH/HpaI aldolase family protein [Bacillus sp. 1P02SD]|uniref:HpcH/HpaI aldolase family protein n=1 Tax=Bacillus sp. 1P02SD TaxID=3132264 RepID=UPI00399F395D